VAADSVDEISQALAAAGESVCRLGKVTEHADNGPRVSYIRS
jgi:hypothetical protein